jgi:hypothetical protein
MTFLTAGMALKVSSFLMLWLLLDFNKKYGKGYS